MTYQDGSAEDITHHSTITKFIQIKKLKLEGGQGLRRIYKGCILPYWYVLSKIAIQYIMTVLEFVS